MTETTGAQIIAFVSENKYDMNDKKNRQRAIDALQKQLAKEKRKRAKQRKKEREKNLYIGFKPTTPSRKQKKS